MRDRFGKEKKSTERKFCSACGCEFKPQDLTIWCRSCLRVYHARCWEKSGGCTTHGCPGKPALTVEREKEQYICCPCCGEKISSFAVKCRYCRSLIEKDSGSGRTVPPPPAPAVVVLRSPRKDPILASLLNLIFPGAGYMYIGQSGKGFFWFLIALAAWYFTRWGMLAVYFWVMYDAPRQAMALNREEKPIMKNKSL